MRLPSFGIRRPVTVTMLFLGVAIVGLVSLGRLPIDMLPEIEPPVISIITLYPGAGAEDVETKVTEWIEDEMNTVNNIKEITSTSKENFSIVRAEFEWGTNLDEASNDIRTRLEYLQNVFPDDVERSWLFKLNTATMPIMMLGFSAEKSYRGLYHLVDDRVVDPLQRIPGVGSAGVWSELERQIEVRLDPELLQAYNLSVQQLAETLKHENITLPAGTVKAGTQEYAIRIPGEFQSVDEIQNVIVGQAHGAPVYLRDVAEVVDGLKERMLFVRCNGKPGLTMWVRKQVGANTVEVADAVKRKLEEIMETLPPDIESFAGFDQSLFIKHAIDNLTEAVLFGGILVVLVVFLFLRRMRSSIIIILTIPLSLIAAFVVLYYFDKTLNMISLMSLAIATGMVVDDAIVVLENILRHIEEGERPFEAAANGASEVGMAVVASTLTTVVIFIPLMFLSEITGILFRQLALVITVTIMASLFASLTFTPMACSRFLGSTAGQAEGKILGSLYRWSEEGFHRVEAAYANLLGWGLGHRKSVMAMALLIFLVSLPLLGGIGTEFMPEEDTGDIFAAVRLPVGTRLEETEKVGKKIEKTVYENVPELASVLIRGGQTKAGIYSAVGGQEAPNAIEVETRLVSRSERKRSSKEIAQVMREKIGRIPGINELYIDAGNPFMFLLYGAGRPVSVEIIGHDIERTDAIAAQVRDIIRSIPGTTDVSVSRDVSRPELQVIVDREKAALLGINTAMVADTLRTNFYGKDATTFREGGEEYDIFLRLGEDKRKTISDIEDMTISSLSGKLVKLKTIATVKETVAPLEMERKDLERVVRVGAGVHGRSQGKVAADIDAELAKLELPHDITIQFGGQYEEQVKAFRDLSLLLVLAIILVYMVMASQFESLLDPFAIMFSIPFAFTGVILLLFVTRTHLGVTAFIGIIMLMGIVVKNAIVLVDYINILRSRGVPLLEAVKVGGSKRLRPVLMTTFTTVLGILPLALARGEGSDLWRPMAIAVIGGLVLSTLVTLVLVPTLYTIFEERLARKPAPAPAKKM